MTRTILNKISFPRPKESAYDLSIIGLVASEKMIENVDGRTDDGRTTE